MQKGFSEAVGRGMVGSALLVLGYWGAKNGLLRGARTYGDPMAETQEARGALPGSALIGGKWHTINPISPAGQIITIGATLAEQADAEQDKSFGSQAGAIAPAVLNVALDQPMLQGAEDVVGLKQHPDSAGQRMAASFAGSFVPTMVADIAAATDSHRRETRSASMPSAVGNAMKNRLPWLRNTLPEKTDSLGRTSENDLSQIVNPGIGVVDRSGDPVVRELLAERKSLTDVDRKDRLPNESDAQYELRQRILGGLRKWRLEKVIQSEKYRRAGGRAEGSNDRRDMLEKAMRDGGLDLDKPRWLGKDFKALPPQKRDERLKKAFEGVQTIQ
jgi:hypothetical protein